MEWLTSIKAAVDYMEDNLTEIRSPEEVADHINMSCMYLQRGFQILTGYSLGEYMRNRRLYLAAIELSSSETPIIDIAYKYGYETPASFDKAFSRFHGVTPMDIRKGRGSITSFLRLNISVAVKGGSSMQFRIENKKSIDVVGFQRTFNTETNYTDIPKFWDEILGKYASHLMKGEAPVGEMEEYVAAHHIGEFGICIEELSGGLFNYMIAGYYNGDHVPEGMIVRRTDATSYAVFECTLSTLQDTNKAIWGEWLPGNSEYELSGDQIIEWYSPEGGYGDDQKCEIWYPVKRKQ